MRRVRLGQKKKRKKEEEEKEAVSIQTILDLFVLA